MPRLVDLSQEIFQGMGVYPGHLKTVVWDHATHEETLSRFPTWQVDEREVELVRTSTVRGPVHVPIHL